MASELGVSAMSDAIGTACAVIDMPNSHDVWERVPEDFS